MVEENIHGSDKVRS